LDWFATLEDRGIITDLKGIFHIHQIDQVFGTQVGLDAPSWNHTLLGQFQRSKQINLRDGIIRNRERIFITSIHD
jgi:hypothetical protein